MKLVWIRVLPCTLQLFDGLRANLEVLLLKKNKKINAVFDESKGVVFKNTPLLL